MYKCPECGNKLCFSREAIGTMKFNGLGAVLSVKINVVYDRLITCSYCGHTGVEDKFLCQDKEERGVDDV